MAPRLQLRQRLAAARARLFPADWPALRWLIGLHVVLQLTGIAWDLPASFEWENDGVAPRDFFAGIVHNLPPGPGHTYPLLHNLLLGLLNLPTLLVSVATAPAWNAEAIRAQVLGYPTMTAVYLTAKLLSVAMGAVALAALARVTARLFNRRAGVWALLFAMTNLSVAYYGRTVNLDGPYLCWMALAADRLLDVLETGAWRDYRDFALLLAASIATKDQAYAAWLLTGPLLLVVWPLLRPGALAAGRGHWRLLARAVGVGALGLAAMGGALWNPPGFVNRLHALTGHASQDWRMYEATFAGVARNLLDLAASLPDAWWPLPVFTLLPLLVLLPRTVAPGAVGWLPVARAVPALLALSQLLCFTLVVARIGHRFALPTGFWLAVYLGAAADLWIAHWVRRGRWGGVARELVALLWLLALAQTLSVQVAQWSDARREVEAWLRRLPAGTTVAIAGPVVSQPRWGLGALQALRVTRWGPQPPRQRNPLPGVQELQGDLDDLPKSQPDAIVLPAPFVSEFAQRALRPGERVQAVVEQHRSAGGMGFFGQVVSDTVPGYRAFRIDNRYPGWLQRAGLPAPHVHSSVGESVYVLVRRGAGLPEPER